VIINSALCFEIMLNMFLSYSPAETSLIIEAPSVRTISATLPDLVSMLIFTSPKDVDSFVNDPTSSKALHYDLVLNGSELGSGSQRINDPSIQTKVLEMWGLSDSDIKNRFGWFIEALSYGTPQHAGIALGIDRFVAVMLNTESIRDVIPFPKTQSGLDPLTGAPSVISENELTEYNLKYIEEINEE